MGKMLNDHKVKKYLEKRRKGWSQIEAASKVGISRKAARKWEDLPLPSKLSRERSWRTRKDPFAEVWDREVVPCLVADRKGELQAQSVLRLLAETHGDTYPKSLLRTLQRRIREWRALQGPPREVYFEQVHPPGREAQFDFSCANELGVTVAGQPFEHLFFEMVLCASGYRYVGLAHSESFEALSMGLQDALQDFGGACQVVRSDNMSAATHELRSESKRVVTQRFASLLAHYGLEYTRIKPGRPHENGVAERAHGVFKGAVNQDLLLRQSRDFDTLEAYKQFIEGTRQRLNARVAEAFAAERRLLRPLPAHRLPEYSDLEVTVRLWSTIRVRENTYSVPSRLIGHRVSVRIHPDVVEVRYKDQVVAACERLRGRQRTHIDYRHVIDSLVRKPGAFARWRYREEMFPSLTFRRAYDALVEALGDRADLHYLRLLHLAARNRQEDVEALLDAYHESGRPPIYEEVKDLVQPPQPSPSTLIEAPRVDLASFDELIQGDTYAQLESASTDLCRQAAADGSQLPPADPCPGACATPGRGRVLTCA